MARIRWHILFSSQQQHSCSCWFSLCPTQSSGTSPSGIGSSLFLSLQYYLYFGYQKNEKADISKRDEEVLKLLGAKLLRMDDSLLSAAIKAEQIWEISL